MKSPNNVFAAVQVLKALPIRTLLLAVPVAASTALALATLSIDHGLTEKADQAARSFGLDVISIRAGSRVVAGKSGTVGTLSEEDVQMLRSRLRGAKIVLGTRIEDNVPTSFGGKNGVYRVFAVTPPWDKVRQFGAERGLFIDQSDVDTSARVCVIGQTVARELFASQNPIGEEININQVPFRVKGVLVSKGASPAEGDRDARIVVPLTTFYDRLYKRLHLDQILVQSADVSSKTLGSLEDQIRMVLRRTHHIAAGQTEDFTLRLPEKIAEESRGISRSVFFLLLGLASVCAVVAVLVILLVTQQTIRARRAEIGIRRALGATPTDILQQIWAEGWMISVTGGLLGLMIGFGAARGLAAWRNLVAGVDVTVVVGPLLIVAAASLAGLWPARAAARLDPAEALRGAA